ncbi:MAG: polysulfide reductase NrfD [Anaerolineae bacterium]|nr:polysulfide reductase NrfD [Anaerolineae bacterium]
MELRAVAHTVIHTTRTEFEKLSKKGKIVLVTLAALAGLGIVTGIYRLLVGLGSTTNLSDAYPWGLWLGFDFTLIAFGGTAFTMAMVVHVFNQEKYHSVLRPALLTGFLGYISVLVILLIDLGRPDRFWGFIPYANVHSPLFEICWCILIYTTVLAFEVAPMVFERLNQPRTLRIFRAAIIPVTIVGIAVSTCHQSTLGTIYLALPARTHELWWSWVMPILYYLSAIGMGLSAAILVMLVGSKALGREPDMEALGGLGKISVWIWVAYLLLRIEDLLMTGDLRYMTTLDSRGTRFWVEILLMVVTPIVLYSIRNVRTSKVGLLWTALAVTLGLGFNRFNPMFSERPPVPIEVSYFPSLVEFIVQIGVLAAAALAWYVLARLLPIFEPEHQHA